jgi:GrpB-like predicted nucleotidyltransferase (UPF0157 family)
VVRGETFSLAADPDAARLAAEALFNATREQLTALLPPSSEVLHIGATSVPGCLTKGDLDIVVRVARADFAAAETALARRFARNEGSIRNADFAAFEDAGRSPHLGVQLTVKGGALDVFHLFSDALRNRPDLVQRYNRLKLDFHDKPMASYREAKDAFVAEVLASCSPAASENQPDQ